MPTKITTAADCFDYYLENFESLFKKILEQEVAKNPKKRKQLISRSQEKPDHERWLEIFEKKSRKTIEEEGK